MVHYVITPWRDRAELLLVRRQFHGDPNDEAHNAGDSEERQQQMRRRRRKEQHRAVARVSMWVHRGHCPHMVDSTALLMAAVLSDEEAGSENAASSAYALRAAYSAAFSR